jgi:transporter family-2 protein
LRRATRDGRLKPIELLGGLGGGLFVASQGITVGTIGVALFIVAFTAGQSASSLAVDHFGLSPNGSHQVAASRVGAAVLAVVAVVVAAGERLVADASLLIVGCALLAFVAGTVQAVQQALNGRVAAVGESWAATWNNFLIGTSGLVAFSLVSLLFDGHIRSWPDTWWLYMGGACGIVFVWVAAWAVRTHGVLVLGLCMIAGQVATATVLDVVGEHAEIGVLGITASILTLIGVAMALWAGRQRVEIELSHN